MICAADLKECEWSDKDQEHVEHGVWPFIWIGVLIWTEGK